MCVLNIHGLLNVGSEHLEKTQCEDFKFFHPSQAFVEKIDFTLFHW